MVANNLYRSVGFQQRETNVYNLEIKGSVVSRLQEFIENEVLWILVVLRQSMCIGCWEESSQWRALSMDLRKYGNRDSYDEDN